VILHRYAYSDSSWVVKALSAHYGVLSFLVKGGKQARYSFKNALSPLAMSEVVFNKSSKSDLHFVKEATLLEWFPQMQSDLEALAMAQVMAEIVLRYAPSYLDLDKEFDLLVQALTQLNEPPYSPSVLVDWLFNMNSLWGYSIATACCIKCGGELTEAPADFFLDQGGCVCKNCCNHFSPKANPLFLKDLWHYNQNKPIEKIPLMEKAFFMYLQNHSGAEREIHSLQWLKEVRKICSV